jgi:hypothetical protein
MGMQPKASKAGSKYWDGYPLHPFIVAMNGELTSVGFSFLRQDASHGAYVWRKELGVGYEIGLCISSARLMSIPVGKFTVNAWMTIFSEKQKLIDKALVLHECYSRSSPHEDRTPGLITYIFDKILASMKESSGGISVACFPSEDSVEMARAVTRRLSTVMESILEKSFPEPVLAETLLKVPSACVEEAINVVSPRQHEYAATLFAICGQKEKALDAIHLGVDAKTRSQSREELCRLERVRRWIESRN